MAIVVFVVVMLKSNLLIPNQNTYMRITKKSTQPYRAGPPAHVHMKNFHLIYVGSWQNKFRSHLGGLVHFSYKHIMFLLEFSKEEEISHRRVIPLNWANPPPYELPLKHGGGKKKRCICLHSFSSEWFVATCVILGTI